VRIYERLSSTLRWRAYLLDHPFLVLELGFRPHLDVTAPYGLRLEKTVPSVDHLNAILRSLDGRWLADLFAQTVQALQAEIPGLGEVVAYDVKHIYANVKENNQRVYLRTVVTLDHYPIHVTAMLPSTFGMSTKPWPIVRALPPFPSTIMVMKKCLVTPMAPHDAQPAYACTRPISLSTPTAFAPIAFAAPCSFPPVRERPVSTPNSPKAKAVSRIPIGKKAG